MTTSIKALGEISIKQIIIFVQKTTNTISYLVEEKTKKKMSIMEITLHVTKASDLPVPCPIRKIFTFP